MISALIITIIVETLLAFIINIRNKHDLINIILVNIITNPLVNSISLYFLLNYGFKAKDISLAICELSTFLVEGFIYSKTLTNEKINPYLISFILNVSSYLLGLVITNIF